MKINAVQRKTYTQRDRERKYAGCLCLCIHTSVLDGVGSRMVASIEL